MLELNFSISSTVVQAPWVLWNAKRTGGNPEAGAASVQRPLGSGKLVCRKITSNVVDKVQNPQPFQCGQMTVYVLCPVPTILFNMIFSLALINLRSAQRAWF